jgi:PAS domain S-box-containing protein
MADLDRYIQEIEALRGRLAEAEETLEAIRTGEVDAIVAYGVKGEQIFTLQGAEQPYRVMVETINEGAATLSGDGLVLYANHCLADMLKIPLETIIGSDFSCLVAPQDQSVFEAILPRSKQERCKIEVYLQGKNSSQVPVLLSLSPLDTPDLQSVCMVVTDLTEQKHNVEIQAAERMASAIIDQAAEAMLVCDANGEITRANQIAHQLAGKNPLFLPFETVFPLNFDETTQDDRKFSIRAVLAGEVFKAFEARLERRSDRNKTPQVFHLLVSAAPLVGTENDTLGCVITLMDVTERHDLLKEIESQKAFLNATLQQLPSGVIIADAPFGNLTFANEQAELICGQSFNSMENMDAGAFFPGFHVDGRPYSPEEWPLFRSINHGEVVRNEEIEITHSNGDARVLNLRSAPIMNHAGQVIAAVMVFNDITRQKLAQQRLQESEERFRHLANAMPQLVWTALPNGQVGFYNQRVQEYDGISPSKTGEWRWSPVLHPDDMQPTVDAWKRAVETGETYQIEHLVKMADGTYRWHLSRGIPNRDTAGQVIRWYGTATDIHESKLVEQALRESEARLQAALHNSGILVFQQDRDLRYSWIQNSHPSFLGINLVGQTDEDFLSQEEAAVLSVLKRRVLESGQKTQAEVQLTIRGVTFFYDMNIEPLFDRKGSITGILGTLVDVTSRKNLLDRQRRINERLDQRVKERTYDLEKLNQELQAEIAERRQAQGDLVELQRHLMNSIESERLCLAQELHDNPMQELYGTIFTLASIRPDRPAEIIRAELDSVREQILSVNQSLRAISHDLRPPTLSGFGLSKAIQAHVRDLLQTRHPELIIQLDLMEDQRELPEHIRVSLFRIYQIVLTNALRHSQAKELNIRFSFDAVQVCLEIQDDGQGFEMPQRLIDFARKGHLGLVGAKERAEAMGGKLLIDTQPGRGTCVCVILPYPSS